MNSINIESGVDCTPVAGYQLFAERTGLTYDRARFVLDWILQNPTRDNRLHHAATTQPQSAKLVVDVEQYYEVVTGIGKNGKGIPSVPREYRLTATMEAFHAARVAEAKREAHKAHLQRLQNIAAQQLERSHRAQNGKSVKSLRKRLNKYVKTQFTQAQMFSRLNPFAWKKDAEQQIGRAVVSGTAAYLQSQCDSVLAMLGYSVGMRGLVDFATELVCAVRHIVVSSDSLPSRLAAAASMIRWGKYQSVIKLAVNVAASLISSNTEAQAGHPAWLDVLPAVLGITGLGFASSFFASSSFKSIVTVAGAFNGAVKMAETVCKALKAFFEWSWEYFTGSPWTEDELTPIRNRIADWQKRVPAIKHCLTTVVGLAGTDTKRRDVVAALTKFCTDYMHDWVPLYHRLVGVEDRVVQGNVRNLGAVIADLYEDVQAFLHPGGNRSPPVGFLAFGPPRQGKTIAAQLLANMAIVHDGVECVNINDQKWAFPRGVEYFNGYAGQHVVMLDDIFQVTSPEQLTRESGFVFSAFSSLPYNVPMAEISRKRTFFTSAYVMATCNMQDETPDQQQYTFSSSVSKTVTSMDAMLSRFANADRTTSFIYYVRSAGTNVVTSGRLGASDLCMEELDANWDFVKYRIGKTQDGIVCLERTDVVHKFSEVLSALVAARSTPTQLSVLDNPANVARVLGKPNVLVAAHASASNEAKQAADAVMCHAAAGGTIERDTCARVSNTLATSGVIPPSLLVDSGVGTLMAPIPAAELPGGIAELEARFKVPATQTRPEMFTRLSGWVKSKSPPSSLNSPTSPMEVVEFDAQAVAVALEPSLADRVVGSLRNGIHSFLNVLRGASDHVLPNGLTVGVAASVFGFACLGLAVYKYMKKNQYQVVAQGFYPTEVPRMPKPTHVVTGGFQQINMNPAVAQSKLEDRRRYLSLEMSVDGNTFGVECCLLHERIGAIPFHFMAPLLRQDSQGVITLDPARVGTIVITQGGRQFTCPTTDVRLFAVPSQDMAYIVFPSTIVGLEAADSLRKTIATANDHTNKRVVERQAFRLRTWDSNTGSLREVQVSPSSTFVVEESYTVDGCGGAQFWFRPTVYSFALPSGVTTNVGDCGSLYLSVGINPQQTQVWAMHVAGRAGPTYRAFAVRLVKEDLEQVIAACAETKPQSSRGIVRDTVEKLSEQGIIAQFGVSELHYAMPSRSAFRTSPLHPENNSAVLAECSERGFDAGKLAWLHKFPDGGSPVARELEKYTVRSVEADDIIAQHASRIVSGVLIELEPDAHSLIRPTLLSSEEAIRGIPGSLGGIPLGTSPGHPFSTGAAKAASGATGKRGLLKVDPVAGYQFLGEPGRQPLLLELVKVLRTLLILANSSLPSFDDARAFGEAVREYSDHFYYVVYPKDEVRPSAKADVSTRSISAGSLVQQILSRIFFGSYMMHVRARWFDSGDAFAINPHSSHDWGLLWHRMTKHPNHMNGDYKAYDKNLPLSVVHMANKILVEWYRHYAPRNEVFNVGVDAILDEFRSWFAIVGVEFVEPKYKGIEWVCRVQQIILAESEMPRHLVADTWYRVEGSNPSGHPLTIERNGLANRVLHRAAFYECNPSLEYSEHVRNVFVGDDSWVSVSAEASDFNQRSMASFCKRLGMTYTDANKNSDVELFTPLSDVVLCKRKFEQRGTGRVWAPLPLEVLWRSMFYFPVTHDREVVVSTFRSVLVELGQQPEHERERFMGVWREAMREAGLQSEFVEAGHTLSLESRGLF